MGVGPSRRAGDEGAYWFGSPAGERLPSNKSEEYITIVSGLPRSGTSMMMQMLAAGGMPVLSDNIRRADEDNPRGYYEYEAVKTTNQDASWLKHAYGKAVKMVYLLLYELPQDYNYRVVLMTRKISEVIASQETMLQRHSRDTGALNSAELGRLFENELLQLQSWLQDRSNFEVLKMNYNSVIRDPDSEVRRLVAFIDRNLDMRAMVAVLDRSLYRHRRQ
jgi:hypothetical protein